MADFSNSEQMTSLTPDQVLDATQAFREHFGVSIDPRQDPIEFDAAIDEVNPRFQGDRKYIDVIRYQLEGDTTDYTTQDQKIIMRAAASLDMLAPETPLIGGFDVVAGLGAARMANYDRLKYGAEAIISGKAEGILVAIGGLRRLGAGEVEAAAYYAPEGATTEADLVNAAAEKIGEEYDIEVPVFVVDNERAHNALLFEGIVRAFPHVKRMAGVTTQIYQVRTSLDFELQGKASGVSTAIAGNPSDPALVAKRTPATYQSEVAGAQKAAAKHFLQG